MQEEYDSQPGSPGPSKRRRYSRVSRACNECRVRKIRCNGRQPCEPCKDFERHCTFTSTRGQRMAGAPRTKILEDRLRRARALISKLQAQNPSTQLNAEVNSIFDSPPGSPGSVSDTTGITDDSSGDYLENMMDGRGRLTSNKKCTSYYGGGSGFAFLQKTQQFFTQGSPGDDKPVQRELPQDVMSKLFDSPLPAKEALRADVSFSELLPSRQTARELLDVVFGQTHQLLQFLHEPTFQKQTDRIYDLDPMDFEDSDHDFLSLFYSVTAIGYLFHQKMHHKYGCKGAVDQAMRHFSAARRMINVDRCRDILSLQTLVCFSLFLMSTARLATAHTYIGLAVTASMRMGLHSQTSGDGLTILAKEINRRVFWTIVKLDMYTALILGLPGMIDLEYVDQSKPSGLSRDYANQENGGFASITTRRMFAASAQYLELLTIIGKVAKRLYPKTDKDAGKSGDLKKHFITNAVIGEMEEDFKAWREGLADALGSPEGQDSLSSIVYELEMVHNFGHILLYRPFLHYLAKTKAENPPDPRLLRCATSCVKISRFTISRSDEMLRQGFLAPAAWQSVYTIFLSLVTLIFFLATQRGNKEYAAIQKETECGIQILHRTSCSDIGSRRCLDVLRVLVKKLSHIIDLDVDKLPEGLAPLCQSQISSPRDKQKVPQRPARRDDVVHLQRSGSDISEASQTPPMQPSNPRKVVYRPQVRSTPSGSMNVNSGGLPIYHSPGMPYVQISMWEQSMGVSATAQSPYFGRPAFPYDGPSSQPHKQEYGPPEMEVPFTEGFAWPFQMGHESAGEGSGAGSAPQPPSTHTLTQQDIAAFMRINPGEEPFI